MYVSKKVPQSSLCALIFKSVRLKHTTHSEGALTLIANGGMFKVNFDQ